MEPFLTHLECARTGARYDAYQLHNLSPAGAPLLARYDLEAAGRALHIEDLAYRRTDMWRYLEVLPARHVDEVVSLGEGYTPLHRAERLGARSVLLGAGFDVDRAEDLEALRSLEGGPEADLCPRTLAYLAAEGL